ncbi:MAG: hypothetical protein GTO45_32655 [Candidatus Aminicenantes bacterium]|nr:hypothetical protein [Candidatus Aminicenantes bacterium]NIM83502.1 hypothetical protein [Candidatus Aminicenantes bacterium]NIN22891.1 hypothetical protein [Candidatus Aminicenantes bacterium]NIN46630.1 hypothetical protein [Candidatus Aminicenantes bacterium]NIN89533.1 hypothetical protein [Candidatus Aminicenantes bacterium]
MEEKKYKIIFKGDVVPGRDLETAKQNLAKLYHVDVNKVESLFSGKLFVLKEDVSLDEAQKHMFHLEEAGVVCEIEEMPMVLESQAAEPAEPSASEPEPEPEPPRPPERMEQVELPEPSEQLEQAVPGQVLEQEPPPTPTPPPMPQQQFTFRKAPRKTSSSLLLLFFIVVVVAAVIVIFKPFSTQKQITGPAVSPSESQSREPSPSPTTPERPAQRTAPALPSDLTEPYNEPNGYYSISLPAGYKSIPKPPGDQGQTEVSFMYADRAIVTISTTPRQTEWDSQQAMMQKVTAIQTGNDKDFSNYRINEYQPITISSLRGYEILLEMGDRVAHVYGLVSPTDIIFAIKIITFGQANHDILVSAVRESLVVY